jgi:hypothetical protein
VAVLQDDGEPEGAALPDGAVGSDFSAHHLDQALGQGKAETSAAVLSGGRTVRLMEVLEQMRQLLAAQADAGVGDLEAHQQLICARFQQQGTHAD